MTSTLRVNYSHRNLNDSSECCLMTHAVSEVTQCHERHFTLLITCRSPNQTQALTAVSLVSSGGHFDLPPGI